MARQRWLLGLIISLTAASLFLLVNPILKTGASPFRLGLDLQGGSQLTLQVKPSDTVKDIASSEGQKAMADVERVISDRVNRLDVIPVRRIAVARRNAKDDAANLHSRRSNSDSQAEMGEHMDDGR